jgi:CheY-like chemotaxis protein
VNRSRVLVVDDDPKVASSIERMLRSVNEVCIETSAKSALARILAGERFDVILCDMMMPDMTGTEFYEELSRNDSHQGARVVFMTAGAFTERARSLLDRVPNERIPKPCRHEELSKVLLAVASREW